VAAVERPHGFLRGALYYLGQPKDGHEEPDAVYPETSGHNALPIEDEAAEDEFAQDEAHGLDAEEPEETSPSRSSKSSRWGSLRWNSGRASRKSTLEEESSEQGVPADHAPQIGADEFAAEPHELSEEPVHEEYVEYAESYSAEDAQQHFSGTSHARRLPPQLHPKYPPQQAPEPVLYDDDQGAGHEASYEQAPSAHAFSVSAEEAPAQDVFVQPKNLHRAPAPQPEAQRHETRFVGSSSAQGQPPRRPAHIPGTHLRPLERTSELFDQEVQTTPTGQIPVTPAPGNTADAPQRDGAVPGNGFLESAPASTNQTQGYSAPSGMSNTSAQDAAFGSGMQDRADNSAHSAPYRGGAAHNPYLAQPQNTTQNPYAAPAQGYGTHQDRGVGQHQGMQQNQNAGQNRQAAQTGLGQQSLGEQQGYGQRRASDLHGSACERSEFRAWICAFALCSRGEESSSCRVHPAGSYPPHEPGTSAVAASDGNHHRLRCAEFTLPARTGDRFCSGRRRVWVYEYEPIRCSGSA